MLVVYFVGLCDILKTNALPYGIATTETLS